MQEYRRLGVTFKELRRRDFSLPPFDLWRARFTPCNAEFLQCLLQGKLQVKPQMVQLAGQQVQFADGSTIDSDAIVCCTGYTLRFPFLPATLVEIRNNRMNLYKHVFPPAHPNLAFVGFCSVAGSHLPAPCRISAPFFRRGLQIAHAGSAFDDRLHHLDCVLALCLR